MAIYSNAYGASGHQMDFDSMLEFGPKEGPCIPSGKAELSAHRRSSRQNAARCTSGCNDGPHCGIVTANECPVGAVHVERPTILDFDGFRNDQRVFKFDA